MTTRVVKNAFEIMKTTTERDSRSRLFSSNCPIRIGTSGYSYKKFVQMVLCDDHLIHFDTFSWHSVQKYYPDQNEFDYYCGVGVIRDVFFEIQNLI